MRRLARLLPLLLMAALLPAAAGAQRAITLREFDADLFVRETGELEVAERIRLHFAGEWNGFIRTIPVRYRTPQGFGYRLRLEVESITDEAGRPLRYESGREGDSRALKIWVPGARDATRTVVLRYRVRNALRFFDAGDPEGARDELYWNVTGDGWEMPIERAGAHVYLPAGMSGVRALAFTGVHGATEQAAHVETDGRVVTARATRAFAPGEGLTIAVAWDPGVVQRPGAAGVAGDFLRGNWYFVFPVLAFCGMLYLWRTRGRDPRLGARMVHYEPPHGMTPAELGTLVDHSADMQDVTATLVDLAVRGYLAIEEVPQKKLLGLRSETDYVFHLVRPVSEWDGLLAHERVLLRAIFDGSPDAPAALEAVGRARGAETGSPLAGLLTRVQQHAGEEEPTAASATLGEAPAASVPLSALEDRFYTHLDGIRSAIYDRLVARGFYRRRPDHVKAAFVGAAVVVGVGLAVLGIWAGEWLDIEPLTAIVSGVLSGLSVLGFGLFMPARTPAGAAALSATLGFREFLARVESDRFRRMIRSPEQFEQYLPHAMALGVEERWAAAFEGIYREVPQWYRGTSPAGFHTGAFVRSLDTMSTRTSRTMTSRPSSRASGGSGFGGGSSGGGFGGGGGRGF